jgi:hypothetical protein
MMMMLLRSADRNGVYSDNNKSCGANRFEIDAIDVPRAFVGRELHGLILAKPLEGTWGHNIGRHKKVVLGIVSDNDAVGGFHDPETSPHALQQVRHVR